MVNIPKIRDGDVLLWMPAMRPDRWSTTNLAQVTIPHRWMTIICDYGCEDSCGKSYHAEGPPDTVAEIWLCSPILRGELCGVAGSSLIANTILHELVHEACYLHNGEDMPNSCEISCFVDKTDSRAQRCLRGR
jgi:hypothetical protein